MKRARCHLSSLGLLLVLLSATPLFNRVFAQVDVATSTVKGKVTDQFDAVVTGATLTASNVARGVVRSVKTDGQGTYHVPLLQPGVYDLRVEATGFQPQVFQKVALTVGQVLIYDVKLQPGELREEVSASASAAPMLIETSRTQQSDTIERNQIASLPNISRNFTNYVFTLSSVGDTEAARVQQTRVISLFRTSGFSVGGSNGRNNYVSIDGGENDSGTGGLRVRNLSVEAVQEFQVNLNAFAAEYGFTAGTAVNFITRGGTNDFHGSGYAFYRSEKIAARDPLNQSGQKAHERRLVPGFTFGGPLTRNKTFFFTSFENVRYDIARVRSFTNDGSILQPTPAQAAYLNSLETGPNATIATRNVAAEARSFLSVLNHPATKQVLDESEGQFITPSRGYNWTTRFDYNHGDHDFFNGRFTWSKENNDLLNADNADTPSAGINERLDDYTLVGTWGHVFSDRLINQVRAQFAASDYRQVSPAPEGATIIIAGLLNYGRNVAAPLIIKQKRYQVDDVLSLNNGTRDFKFGVSYRPVDLRFVSELGFGGLYIFAGGLPLRAALAPQSAGVLTGPLAPPDDTALTSLQSFSLGLPVIWQQGFGNSVLNVWQHNLGAFGQVSWRVGPRLTLDLGTRLNYDGEPEGFDSHLTLSPRAGFAWDPFGKGRTVIRGGMGTFYAPIGLHLLGVATLQSSSGRFLNFPSRTFLDGAQSPANLWAFGMNLGKLPFIGLNEKDVRAFGITPTPDQSNRRIVDPADDYDNPYTVQASLGLSQQLGRNFALDIAFQMYHGVHLPIALEANYKESGQLVNVPGLPGSDLFGPQLERIDPSIAQKILHSSEGNSIYYGMTASLLKRFSRGSQFRVSYTYSKAIDDVLDFAGDSTPYLPTRRFLERGISAYDLRHNFVASGSYESPFKTSSGRWFERALADVTLSPIITLRTGFPFNLYIGSDVNGDLNITDRPFHAPRNSGIGENFYSFDLRLSKSFFLRRDSEGPRVDVIVEGTNLFNRANFLRVNDTVCGTTGQAGFINGCDPKFLIGPFDFRGSRDLPPTAPLGFVSAASPRQFQFGLRLEF